MLCTIFGHDVTTFDVFGASRIVHPSTRLPQLWRLQHSTHTSSGGALPSDHQQNADPGSMPAMRPVRVGLALTVWKVHGIDYKKGELTLTVWLKMYWADPRLAYESYDLVPEWDSATMNVGAPLDSIWYPDVQLNEVSSDALQEETNFVYGVSIYDKHFMEAKKWNVAWSRQLVLTASCSLYLAAFPFDA